MSASDDLSRILNDENILLRHRVGVLETENERLREALQTIADRQCESLVTHPEDEDKGYKWVRIVACDDLPEPVCDPCRARATL